MTTKELKVYKGSGYHYSSIPQIVLQGKWLESMGFSIGGRVTVSCQDGKIIIEKSQDGQEQQENMDRHGTCAGKAV